MLNYINKYVFSLKMAPLKQGNRSVMGIRGVQGGVRYDRGVVVASLDGILSKKMFMPPTMVSSREVVGPGKGG